MGFKMVDVGEKSVTRRRALATGRIFLSPQVMSMVRAGTSPKGPILPMAEVAGIMAAKNTSQLLPLCHPLLLDSVRIGFETHEKFVQVHCEVICHGKTGVEMEALTGVNVCLLTIYDLAKVVDPAIEISSVHLVEKEGGKSGHWKFPGASAPESVKSYEGLRFAVGVLSDRAYRGEYEDHSGPFILDFIKSRGGSEVFYQVIPDERDPLMALVQRAVECNADVLALSGGTGISERDITPEVLRGMADKELLGFGELQRQYGSRFTPLSWLSRSTAFVVKGTLVVLFPGSPKAVKEGLESLKDLIPHAVKMMRGESHERKTYDLL